MRTPTPLADPPAVVTSFDAAGVVLTVPRAATIVVRIPASPWLSLVDADGEPLEPLPSATPTPGVIPADGCLGELLVAEETEDASAWTVLHAPRAGTYRIGAPYKLPRGSACPTESPAP